MMDFLLPGLKDSWIAGFGLLRLDFQDVGSLDLDFSFGFSGCLDCWIWTFTFGFSGSWMIGSGFFRLDFQDVGSLDLDFSFGFSGYWR